MGLEDVLFEIVRRSVSCTANVTFVATILGNLDMICPRMSALRVVIL